jgi:transcription termination/antitermination protein NusA
VTVLKITYDANLMHFMSVFGSVTNAELKDCFYDPHQMLTFVVKENEIGKAIGKRGFRLHLIENALNRKIKILEFNPDVLQFVRNVVSPLQIVKMELLDRTVVMEAIDSRTRGLLIGRAATNLRNFEFIVKRYFDIDQLRVL